ncbi:MAG: dephospho-CoA kinase [candidate division NC10 bacterium]|nr:dephospho-CoA kinase [candidate division NC10 bacterium]
MLTVGLTGGISSGKTTVARMFARLGAMVLDADRMAHELMQPGGSVYKEIVATFGREILNGKGAIDRSKLGALAFGDPEQRKKLDDIVHPVLAARMAEERERIRRSGKAKLLVVEAALLIESGFYRRFDKIILVTAPEEAQIQRLQERSHLDREEAFARLRSQMSLEEKIPYAHYLIDNSGSLEETVEQVKKVYRELVEEAESR